MRRRFNWSNFDSDFLASIVYSASTPKSKKPVIEISEAYALTPYVEDICSYPNSAFVKCYRREIEDTFLAKSAYLAGICKVLAKRNIRGCISNANADEMLDSLRRMRMTSGLAGEYVRALTQYGSKIEFDDEFYHSPFIEPRTIDLTKSLADSNPVSLYPFQQDALSALEYHFLQKHKQAGLLVMPTGSGKTRTAVTFLLQKMIAAGYQVVWIAHRAMLLEQAADAFYTFAPLLKIYAPGKDVFKIVCVSGSHASIKATERDDDVMVLGVQSAARNMDYLKAVLSDKVIVVVDEAHHAIASSYLKVVDTIRELRPDAKLLGLTATPVRMDRLESNKLFKHFERSIVYQIPMNKLMTQGILSEPVFEKIETKFDPKIVMTLTDREYINKWGEIGPELASKIAGSSERNDVIVQTYLKSKDKYGKTLIFAVNAEHCITLCDEFQKHGIKCDFVYSQKNDNDAVIQSFLNNKLDVLININILTEGSDVPDIQTVFLTRPTGSEVLLMQMVGRGLRGKSAGGTEKAFIVDFCDKWDAFSKWLDPVFIFDDLEKTPGTNKRTGDASKYLIPFSVISEIYRTMRFEQNGEITADVTIPVGWFSILDDDESEHTILVYENQIKGFQAMKADAKAFAATPGDMAKQIQVNYFNDFGILPKIDDIELLLKTVRKERRFPEIYTFEDRKAFDPAAVAAKITEQNMRINDYKALIRDTYDNYAIVRDIFPEFEVYQKRVADFLNYPDGHVPIGTQIEELPEKEIALRLKPTYDLNALLNEVLKEMCKDEPGKIPSIIWTAKCYRSYFGMYHSEDNHIEINRLLNSPDVPKEVVKYIIYHELLHRKFCKHDKIFRTQEHLYPNWTEHERFLDFTFPKFDLQNAY